MEKTEGRVVSTTKSLSPSPHITNEKSEIKKIEEEILQGRYNGKDLFENYVKNNDGYYLDENGKQHIKKNVREAFEAMY